MLQIYLYGHDSCQLELETKVREDFTITEEVPTRAFSLITGGFKTLF